jgi:hypothetical protein
MSKISKLFLSLIIMCGFVMAQNSGTSQTSDPGAAGQPSANQTDPSANGNTTAQPDAQTKKKHKKKKGVPATDQSGTMNNGQTSTSQGTGQTPQDQSVPPPNTPENQAPQANPQPEPPPTTPPQQ